MQPSNNCDSAVQSAAGAATSKPECNPAADDDIPCLSDLFISRDYTTREYRFALAAEVGGAVLTQRIDALAAASTDFDLTGQIVWLVSVVTSHYIALSSHAKGARVLELGAGAGLCGLVATQSAASVSLTDFEDEVLDLLRRNLPHASPSCVTTVDTLSWGSDADMAALPHPQFDLLIGADVVYWQHSIEPLMDTVAKLLAPGGVFVLGYFERVAKMTRLLLEAATQRGLEVEVPDFSWLTVPLGSIPKEYEAQIGNMTIFHFRWPTGGRGGDGGRNAELAVAEPVAAVAEP